MDGWHRWVTLATLAHAFLTVIAVTAERATRPTPAELIPVTVNQLRRLFDALLLRPINDLHASTTGPSGADDTKPAPEPATTGGEPNHHDHEPRPQY